jgi:hypothetical protein
LYSSSNFISVTKSRKMVNVGHVARVGRIRKQHLVEKIMKEVMVLETRRRQECDIKMGHEEVGCNNDWIHLAQDRLGCRA